MHVRQFIRKCLMGAVLVWTGVCAVFDAALLIMLLQRGEVDLVLPFRAPSWLGRVPAEVWAILLFLQIYAVILPAIPEANRIARQAKLARPAEERAE